MLDKLIPHPIFLVPHIRHVDGQRFNAGGIAATVNPHAVRSPFRDGFAIDSEFFHCLGIKPHGRLVVAFYNYAFVEVPNCRMVVAKFFGNIGSTHVQNLIAFATQSLRLSNIWADFISSFLFKSML